MSLSKVIKSYSQGNLTFPDEVFSTYRNSHLKALFGDISELGNFLKQDQIKAVQIAQGDHPSIGIASATNRPMDDVLRRIAHINSQLCSDLEDVVGKIACSDFSARLKPRENRPYFDHSFNTLLENIENQIVSSHRLLEKEEACISATKKFLLNFLNGEFAQSIPDEIKSTDIDPLLSDLKDLINRIILFFMEFRADTLTKRCRLQTRPDLLGKSVNVMVSNFEHQNERVAATIASLKTENDELKTQQKDLLSFNLSFEEKVTHLTDSYESMLRDQHELQNENENLLRRIRQLEEDKKQKTKELKSAKKQSQSLENDRQVAFNSLNDLSIKFEGFTKQLNRGLKKYRDKLAAIIEKTHNAKGHKNTEEETVSTFIREIEAVISRAAEHLSTANCPNISSHHETKLISILENISAVIQPDLTYHQAGFEYSIDPDIPTDLLVDGDRVSWILERLISAVINISFAKQVTCSVYHKHDLSDDVESSHMLIFEVTEDTGKLPFYDTFLRFNSSKSLKNFLLDEKSISLGDIWNHVEAINSEITISNHRNEGISFQLMVPIPKKNDLGLPEIHLEHNDNQTESIHIILGDQTPLTKSLSELVTGKGYKITTIASIEEIHPFLRNEPPKGVFFQTEGNRLPAIMDENNEIEMMSEIPFVAISNNDLQFESKKPPVIGYVNNSVNQATVEIVLSRMAAFTSHPPVHLLAFGMVQSADEMTQIADAVFGSHSWIDDQGIQTDQIRNTNIVIHFVDSSIFSANQWDIWISTIKQTLRDTPIVVVLNQQPGYQLKNKIAESVDGYLVRSGTETTQILTELLLLLELIRDFCFSDRQASVNALISQRGDILNGKQILLVTEKIDDTLAIRKQLSSKGLTIQVIARPKHLPDAFTEPLTVDLVILDLDIEPITELMVADSISTIKSEINIPFVYLQKQHHFGDREFWRASGIEGYVRYPLKIQDLLSTLRAVLIATS